VAMQGEPTKKGVPAVKASTEPKGGAPTKGAGVGDKEDVLRDVADELVTNPIAKMGVAYAFGRKDSIEQNIKEGINKYLAAANLKYYFSIDESYVYRKCRLILCPIIYKGTWKRQTVKMDGGQEAYLPPRKDLNAPDLYIPTMAFITYVLTAGFILGTKKQFTPEVLGRIATTGLISLCFEVVFLKLGFYLLNSLNASALDLLSYSGYIFVSIAFNHLVALFLGPPFFYVVSLVTSVFAAIFMVKTLRLIVLPDASGQTTPLSSNRRNYFVLTVALLQLVIAFFLGFC